MAQHQQQHPYYPPTAHIAGFEPNQQATWQLVTAFAAAAGAVVGVAWFALCGALHVLFEGYYVVNHAAIAGQQTLAAQLWKEYALSDSRYLASDDFLVCVETLTALVLGPLCWLAAAATATGAASRHGLALVACTAHLYGVALYYGTAGAGHSRPEARYFWLYYVGFNVPWVVVPALLLARAMACVSRACAVADGRAARSKGE